MKYYSIDWSKINDYLEGVPEESWDVARPYAVLKRIDDSLKNIRELAGLNIPIYVLGFAHVILGSSREKVLHLDCGNSMSLVPIKNIQSIEGVIPCNKALALMQEIVDEFNKPISDGSCIYLESLITTHGTYLVLMESSVYRTLVDSWLEQL